MCVRPNKHWEEGWSELTQHNRNLCTSGSNLSGAMSVNKSGFVLLENLAGKNLVVFLKYLVCIVLMRQTEEDAAKPDLLVTMHFLCWLSTLILYKLLSKVLLPGNSEDSGLSPFQPKSK